MVVTFRLAEGSADTKVLRLDHVMEEEVGLILPSRHSTASSIQQWTGQELVSGSVECVSTVFFVPNAALLGFLKSSL